MAPREAAARQQSSASAAEAVIALLRENGHLSRQLFRRRMKTLGLTAAEARALLYIGANPGIAQGRLAELLEVQPIALSRIIDGLEATSQVERRLSENDRRLRLLFLTARGRGLVRRLRELHDTLDQAITARLSQSDLARFATALSEVNATLRQMR